MSTRPNNKTPFEWKAGLGSAFNSAFNAQLGNVTYYVASRDYGHPAYLEVRGSRGGLKGLKLGNYSKIEQAKQACERHYAAGCDLSRAERVYLLGAELTTGNAILDRTLFLSAPDYLHDNL